MVAGRASVGAFKSIFRRMARPPPPLISTERRGPVLEPRGALGDERDDSKELARTDPSEQTAGQPRFRSQADRHRRGGAVGTRVWAHPWQCAAAHPALVAAGRKRAVGSH